MILITCVDDNFGLLFNNRRLSKDKVLTERIYEVTNGKKLFIFDFSKDLFDLNKVMVCDNILSIKDANSYCFIENTDIKDFTSIDKVILYFWNRQYPSDLKFVLPPNFKEVKRYEFKGNSHDKITEVEYEKVF